MLLRDTKQYLGSKMVGISAQQIKLTHALRMIQFLLALFLAGAAAQGYARSISLPHTESFNSASSIDDLIWATQGATVTWDSTGGWQNSGSVKITPPTVGQGYGALGGFNGFGPLTRLNIRWLMKVGPTFFNETIFGKIIVMHRQNQESWMRPMMMQNGRYHTDGVLHQYFTVSQGVTNPTGPFNPDLERINPDAYFTMGQDGSNTDIWVSYEFEVDLVAGRINLYIFTEDGQYGGLYATVDMTQSEPDPTTHPITEIACLGCFWGAPTEEPPYFTPPFSSGTYMVVDEVTINNRYIGPPAGFQNNPPPAAINDARAILRQ